MTVKIDKYIKIIDESKQIGWIRDEATEKVIIKINMDTKEHTERMLKMCLEALNTGDFEPTGSVDEFSVFKENLREFASLELEMPNEAIDDWFVELSTQKDEEITP